MTLCSRSLDPIRIRFLHLSTSRTFWMILKLSFIVVMNFANLPFLYHKHRAAGAAVRSD